MRGARTRRRPVVRALIGMGAITSLVACAGGDPADSDGTPSSTGPAATVIGPSSSVPPSTPPPTASEPDGPRWVEGDSDELFDQDSLHTFEIDLPADALERLDANPAAEAYEVGRLTFDGEVVEPIGVRYKGSVGAFVGCTASPSMLAPTGPKTCTKLSMKLKIDWDDPDREFFGQRRIQLHAQNLDGTLMHERLGYWLFREMGVPAPRSTHARVIVNGEYLGVFALTEEIDGRFTRSRFSDGTGNLYKEVWPIRSDGSPRSEEDLLAGLETNEDEDPSAEIISSFAEALVAAPVDERVAVIEQWTDIRTLLTTIVVDRAIRHDDGPLHWYCMPECEPHNFYWYENPTDRTVTLIPWDLDNAFDALVPGSGVGSFISIGDPWGSITNDCQPFPFGAFNLPQRSAACDPLLGALATLDDEFDQIRAALIEGPFSDERVNEQLDTWAEQITPAVAEAAAAHDDAPRVEAWTASIETLKRALETSRAGTGR
ncbi:MAG: hypothetical protein RI958_3192 [Actinomycetota bacterium]